MKYFLDTTFVVALFVSNDSWHSQSLKVYDKIKNHELVISNLVVAETITVLKNKLKTKEISEIYYNLSNIFDVIDDNLIYDEAMDIFIKYDSSISFFDALYVAISKREDIGSIVSFDSDFDTIDEIIRIC